MPKIAWDEVFNLEGNGENYFFINTEQKLLQHSKRRRNSWKQKRKLCKF